MNSPYLRLIAGLLFCLSACASDGLTPRTADAGGAVSADHQILVMLHLPAPHFRPNANYGGAYGSTGGHDARRRLAAELADQHKLKLIADWPMPVLGVDCFVMAVPANDSPGAMARQIAHDPRVESAEPMQLFHTLGHDDPLYPLQPSAQLWHLAELHQLATGKGVPIAEIDTAVAVGHPDLKGQIALSKNFVDDGPSVGEAHGTAVAGIIAARADDAIGIAGVAPGARLLALRACWQERGNTSSCSSFTLAKALQFALDQRAEVINLSLTGPRDRLLERLLDAALTRGVVVVGAADPALADGGFPASHSGVLAIAADDAQRAPLSALRAPGRDIPTTLPGDRWNFVSGSSFAAANVTGLVALLHELSPAMSPAQLRDALGGTSATRPESPRDTLIDACAAVAQAAGTCACGCAGPKEARLLMRR